MTQVTDKQTREKDGRGAEAESDPGGRKLLQASSARSCACMRVCVCVCVFADRGVCL